MMLRATTLAIAVVVSIATRHLGDGRCHASFTRVDTKFQTVAGVMDKITEDFFDEDRSKYEPAEHCEFSTSVGVHAFIAVNLDEALRGASGDVAVADIGSGTGFLLELFHTVVEDGITVVGVEFDQRAVDVAREILPAGCCEVFQGDGFTFNYGKKFAVINVGFASTELPQHFYDITADDATILMPICVKPFRAPQSCAKCQKCIAHFHRFTKADGSWQDTRIEPEVDFFFVEPGPTEPGASLAVDPMPEPARSPSAS